MDTLREDAFWAHAAKGCISFQKGEQTAADTSMSSARWPGGARHVPCDRESFDYFKPAGLAFPGAPPVASECNMHWVQRTGLPAKISALLA
jgi:hypothetical protein